MKTTERLTNGTFAALAARIAAVASQWAGDALMPLQDFEGRVYPATAERFADEIRTRLDRIVELANAK